MALPASLKKRRDFLAAARARRHAAPGVLLQARRRAEGEGDNAPIRVGYTCSKKVGNAVARNRAKRRLREAAARLLPAAGRPGWDYVLIGRAGSTAERPFEALVADLRDALVRVHAPRKPKASRDVRKL
ncbi:MAG: ribonuclease P protein component [Pseudomonadota bacterium]